MTNPMKKPMPDVRQRRLPHMGLYSMAVALTAVILTIAWAGLTPSAQPREKLIVAVASQPAFALIYIAADRGYFSKEGLDVELQVYALGRDALNSVIEHKADLATVYESPVIRQIYNGTPLGIISTLHTSTRSQAVLARRASGISSVTDLKGKRIGVTPGTSMEFLLHMLLTAEGISSADVTLAHVEPEKFESALAQNEVDALVVFGPHLPALQEKFGKDNLAVFYSDLYVETSMLAGLGDNIMARKTAMPRLLAALLRAQEFTKTNPGESLDIVVRQLAAKYSGQMVRQNWPVLQFDIELDHRLLTLMTQQAQWLRDKGVFDSPVPDFKKYITTDFMYALKPEAATLHARAAGH